LGAGGEAEGDKGDTTLSRTYLLRMQAGASNLPTSVHPPPRYENADFAQQILIRLPLPLE